MTYPKTYKGLDLLEKVLEFQAMTPNEEEWNEQALKSNPPRLIRLKQIRSFAQALSIKGTNDHNIIQSILTGDFIDERSDADHADVFAFMLEIVVEEEGLVANNRPISSLTMPYQKLIEYKQHLNNILEFNSGWLEASTIQARFSIYLTESITKNLVGKYDSLDKALELYINPKQLSFTRDELITRYNYPPENLRDVDMEYM